MFSCRRIFSMLWCLVVLLTGVTSLHAETVDRIVAIVNDDVITYSDLLREGEPIFERIEEEAPAWQKEKTLEEARQEILNRLIDKTIVDQRAAQFEITVSDEETDHAIANIMTSNNTTLEAFRSELEKSGQTLEAYRKTIKSQILQSKLINVEVRSKVVITDEMIRDYYNKNYSKRTTGDGYHIRQIGISWDNQEHTISKDEAHEKAEKLRARILNGESFQEIAKQFSDLPSAGDGGDIGTFKKNELSAYMRDTIINMKPGDISKVIETSSGFQFFKLLSIREGDIVTQENLDDVKEEIKAQLYEEEMRTQFDKWVKELRGQAYIKKML